MHGEALYAYQNKPITHRFTLFPYDYHYRLHHQKAKAVVGGILEAVEEAVAVAVFKKFISPPY